MLAKEQGHKRKCSKKIKGLQNFFQAISKNKKIFEKNFQAIYKILTIQKIVLSKDGSTIRYVQNLHTTYLAP